MPLVIDPNYQKNPEVKNILLTRNASFDRYAIGGFDGTKMVPSVEIFDPRLGSWMSGDPINQPRGYAAAAVVKGSIYVIGGLRAGEDMVDSVCTFLLPIHPIGASVTGCGCF